MTNFKYNPINPDNFLDITTASAYQVAVHSLQHLIDQDCQSNLTSEPTESGNSAYRGVGGAMCAAAPFAPDKDRIEEGWSWRWHVRRGDVPPNHELLIERLQAIHDDLSHEDTDFSTHYEKLQDFIGELAKNELAHLMDLWGYILKLSSKLVNQKKGQVNND